MLGTACGSGDVTEGKGQAAGLLARAVRWKTALYQRHNAKRKRLRA